MTLAALASAQDRSHGEVHEDPSAHYEEFVPGASRLDGRILAPCCWNQTLDIHGSPIANELRREIRRRLRAGETAETIEAGLVARYGERILAVKPQSPLKNVAVGLALLMVFAGGGAAALLVRWRRRTRLPPPATVAAEPGAGERDALDDRVDAELKALGE